MRSVNAFDYDPAKVKRLSRWRSRFGKEFILLFLAGFYFLIATNTQSGWLFLLSAFLLGLLLFSWFPPRRAAASVSLKREIVGAIARDTPMVIRLSVTNHGSRPLREILLIEPANRWARGAEEFRWVVPRLAGQSTAVTEYTIIPTRRGEHTLAGSRLRFGVPFGLFVVERSFPPGESFLVYPRLKNLASERRRSRLAGILAEFVSPHSKGDSRSLRALREYRPGDDLRLVHWKSTAKMGGAALMVREHHAPSRQLGLLFLDTSRRDGDGEASESFEDAVSLTASLLWSAHRGGTQSTLVLLDESGWTRLKRWDEQYLALAKVGRGKLSLEQWLASVAQALSELPESRNRGAQPFLMVAANSVGELGRPEQWRGVGQVLLLTSGGAKEFAEYPVRVVDLDDQQLMEMADGL